MSIQTSLSKFQKITANQLEKSQQKIAKLNLKQWNMLGNSWFGYLLAWGILSLYAGKACPFIDENFIFAFLNSLLLQVTLSVFISLAPIYILRLLISAGIGKDKIFKWSTFAYVIYESFFFLLWIAIMMWVANLESIDLLLESKLKMTLGPFVLAFFAVINMTLIRQKYILLNQINEDGHRIAPSNFYSLRIKLIFITTAILLLVGTVIALIGYKNFWWLLHNYEEIKSNTAAGVASVFKEIIFIIGIFIGYMIITVINYTINIRLIFTILNNVIYRIFSRDFKNILLPSLNDEFGIMGENIQIISSEIQEKEDIKNIFGKLVSPTVAEMVLKNQESLDKGVARDIVVMFTDIRSFTAFTNSVPAKDVVAALNIYFSSMVPIVEKYQGMIDKFIGDAMMALFGYDNIINGINNAVRAACFMQDHLYKSHSKFKIGVGISVGEAVVGLVGSPDRLDFTAIGETVNESSRLESACAKMGLDILLAEDAYIKLDESLTNLPWKKYKVTAKGYDKAILAYGLIWAEVKKSNTNLNAI